MEPILELIVKGGDSERVVATACGKCKIVAINEYIAKQCCMPRACGRCGKPSPQYWMLCDDCRTADADEKERQLFEKATKVLLADYDHEYVSLPGSDEYPGIDEVMELNENIAAGRESCSRLRTSPIDWAFAVQSSPWGRPCADSVIEQICDDLYESAHERLDADSLQKVMDEWLESQGPSYCFTEDRSRVVIFNPKILEQE
jgi:hypothetical protein